MITPHNAVITDESKQPVFADLPFRATCSCGTEGRFDTKDDATAWLKAHFRNVHADPKTSSIKDEQQDSAAMAGAGQKKTQ